MKRGEKEAKEKEKRKNERVKMREGRRMNDGTKESKQERRIRYRE